MWAKLTRLTVLCNVVHYNVFHSVVVEILSNVFFYLWLGKSCNFNVSIKIDLSVFHFVRFVGS